MKRKLGRKLLSFLLTLAMVVGLLPGMGLTANAAAAPTTPTSAEALANSDYEDATAKVYFMMPNGKNGPVADDDVYVNHPAVRDPETSEIIEEAYSELVIEKGAKAPSWLNEFNKAADGNYYAGIYWQDSTVAPEAWPGYRMEIDDADNGVYYAVVPGDGNLTVAIFNNGVDGGNDSGNKVAQTSDINMEGAYEGDYGSIPDGTYNEFDFDRCIYVIDPDQVSINADSRKQICGGDWYYYYGSGCYGSIRTDNPDFTAEDSCLNPSHFNKQGEHVGFHDETTQSNVDVTNVTLAPEAAQTIDVGGKVSFTATVQPDNASDKKVKWSVGGTNAGAVKLYTDENCTTEVGADAVETLTVYAKGISAGSATVTATSNADSTKSASCAVTVNAQTPADTYIVAGSEWDIFDSVWNSTSEANKMTLAADGTYTKSYEVSQAYSDVQLKVVKNGQDWIGDQNGYNVTFNLTGAGTFTVSYNPATGVVSVSGDIVAEPAATYYYAGNIAGNYSSSDYTFSATETEGVYSLTNIHLSAIDWFKVMDENYYQYPEVGNAYNITADGTYNIYFRPDGNGGDGWYEGYIKVEPVLPDGFSVIVTAGSNMTKTETSGAASQTGLTGAMTDVVYTANEGYYFPTDYSVTAVNGISVTRNSYTQITVSGTPTANAAITLTAPTAKKVPATDDFHYSDPGSFVYDGEPKAAYVEPDATRGVEGMGEITVHYYSDQSYSTEVTPTNVGTYYVGITATEGDAYKAVSTVLHDASWQFTINRATPIATNFSYNAPSDLTYNGTAKTANVEPKEGVTGMGAVTVKYYSDRWRTNEVTPTNVGTYYVGITLSEGNNYYNASSAIYDQDWQFTISKQAAPASLNDDQKPTANTGLTYTGDELELVTAPTNVPAGYTVQYSLDGTNWSADPPKGTNAGDYTVKVKYVGDGNHEDFNGTDITVTISMATPTLTEPTLEAVTYDPSKTLANVALTGGWTWVTGTTVPTVGNTGYTAVISVDDANYDYSNVTGYDSDAHNVTRTLALTVNKATVTAPTIESKTYNAQNQKADVPESTLYTVTANNGGTEAGDYDVVLALTDAANYKWSDSDEAEKTLIFSIAKVPAPVLTAAQKPTADGATMEIGVGLVLVKAPEETVENYTVMYSLDGENWSEELPTVANIGRFDVFVKYVCDDNHTPFDGETVYVSTIPARVAISDESILGKSDGRLYFVPNDIEYKLEGDTEYKPVTHTFEQDGVTYYDIVDLAAGTYYFHYVASGNYPESEDYYVVIDAGKPITARYISDGEVLEELTGLSYGTKLTKPADPVKEGYKFVGWRYYDKLWSFDNELDSIGQYDFEADKYYYRLEAEWTEKSIISGVITDEEGNPVNDAIVRINDVEISSNENGRFALAVEDGEYNITASDMNSSVTRYIKVEGDTEVNIQLAANKMTFVDNENAGKYEAVVGGLEDVIEAEPVEAGQTVFVELAITSEENINDGDKAAFEAGKAAIKQLDEARGKTVEYFDLMLRKTVSTETDDVVTDLGSTNTKLLTIIIPFSTAGKSNIAVYRYHGGEAAAMEKDPATGNEGYTVGDGVIKIYAKSFSTYAIGYVRVVQNSDSYYTVTANSTGKGTLEVSAKSAVSDTVVTITAVPEEGYKLSDLTVRDAAGEEIEVTETADGTYSFTMPASSVTVKAEFVIVSFVDVPNGSYYEKAVDWAVANGITNGIDKTHFAPDASCTRAQAVTFLWRALGSPEPTTTKSEFTDVAEGAFYYKAVLWAAENGVTLGYYDGRFGVDDNVNRAEMVTFMERAMKGKATSAESFVDVPEGAYFADAAAWAKENGISDGIGGNKFGGETDCLRAQIVTMLYRYFVK